MNWKTFLMPTRRKVILAAIIFLFLPIFPKSVICFCEMGWSCNCPQTGYFSLLALLTAGFDGIKLSLLPLLGLAAAYLFSSFFTCFIRISPGFFKAIKPTKARWIIALLGWLTTVSVLMHFFSGVYGGTMSFPPLLNSLYNISDAISLILLPFIALTYYLLYPVTFVLIALLFALAGLPHSIANGTHPENLTSVGAVLVISLIIIEWYFISCLIVWAFNSIKKKLKAKS